MLLSNFLRAYFYRFFYSKNVLIKRLEEFFSHRGYAFQAVFSGRVAIHEISKKAINNKKGIALVPEYICDVVVKAILSANMEVKYYRVDEKFKLKVDDVEVLFNDNEVSLLLIAPMFGSDGGIKRVRSSRILDCIISHKCSILFDLCQDMGWLYEINEYNYNKIHVVYSFNLKQIPGIMGGVVLSKESLDFYSNKKMDFRKNLRLHYFSLSRFIISPLKALILRLYNNREISVHDKPFDYSNCTTFPYMFTNYNLSKLQISFAIVGINSLDGYRKKQLQFIKNGKITLCGDSRFTSYVISDCNKNLGRCEKKPYAIEGSIDSSNRPSLCILHNKGYLDK